MWQQTLIPRRSACSPTAFQWRNHLPRRSFIPLANHGPSSHRAMFPPLSTTRLWSARTEQTDLRGPLRCPIT